MLYLAYFLLPHQGQVAAMVDLTAHTPVNAANFRDLTMGEWPLLGNYTDACLGAPTLRQWSDCPTALAGQCVAILAHCLAETPGSLLRAPALGAQFADRFAHLYYTGKYPQCARHKPFVQLYTNANIIGVLHGHPSLA